jgi:hypothetical protein
MEQGQPFLHYAWFSTAVFVPVSLTIWLTITSPTPTYNNPSYHFSWALLCIHPPRWGLNMKGPTSPIHKTWDVTLKNREFTTWMRIFQLAYLSNSCGIVSPQSGRVQFITSLSYLLSTYNNTSEKYIKIMKNMAVCQNRVPLVNIKIAGIYGCSSH